MKDANPRVVRAYAILAKGDEPKPLGEQTFQVPSQSGNGKYLVIRQGDAWGCECPDHKFRGVECKHIHAVKFWLSLKDKLKESETFKFDSPKITQCKFCGSPSIIRYGRKGRKQVYKCNQCNHKFVPDDGFKKVRNDPRIIALTLDLYFKGTSLRKIADHLKQFYDLNVNFGTVYKWMEKYMKMISEYVSNFMPQFSEKWMADEMMVNIKGEWHWLWNMMDEETRFLLASMISKNREIQDARKLFAKAKNRAKGKPKTIVTDGLPAYIDAHRKEFFTLKKPRTEHIRHIRLQGDLNNNLIERFHGTRRERDKVLRGMKIEDTRIIDGFDVYYNFIRPHMGLKRQTPAEKANIKPSFGLKEY